MGKLDSNMIEENFLVEVTPARLLSGKQFLVFGILIREAS